jgi:tetratricopeptide (TPR) repeat protein
LLPFAADSPDSQAVKLASATREAVANTLSQGAYGVRTVDHISDDKAPSADFLISGHVTSISGNFVATIRMEEAAHHVVVFDHQFDVPRDSADSLPDLVSGQVASQISATAPLLAIERQHPSNPAVVAALLQGSQAGLDGAGALHDYQKTRPLAATNPNSALAQLTFAFNAAFALGDIPSEQKEDAVAAARSAADRAVALAPDFGDTYAPWCLLHSEQRMVECENHLRAGMRADPDAPFANWFLASRILEPAGRQDEALELARVSLAHDPYMPAKIALMLRLLEATGQTSAADELYRQSTRWWPNDPTINWFRTAGIAEGGDFERLKRFAEQTGDPKKPDPILVAISRNSVAAIRNSCAAAQGFDGDLCMLALAREGDSGAAFALADRLYPSRHAATSAEEDRIWFDNSSPNEVAFLTSRAASPLRRDSRFLALTDRVGLLDYWRSGRLPDFCTKTREPVCTQITSGLRK